MLTCPLPLPDGARVLIAGAGGGFDVFCGLPIAFDLEERGCRVHLASYSFTALEKVEGAARDEGGVVEVGRAARLVEGDYFPERYLCAWLHEERGVEATVHCLPQRGVRPTLAAYDRLVERLGIDAVFCVDGGVDGLFRGDEHDLATPSMDSISVIAAALCRAPRRVYACTAFGVEGAEGRVSHAQALERIAEVGRAGGLLGVGAVLPTTPPGARFAALLEHLARRLPPLRQSIVLGSLRAALRGDFGRVDVHEKTRERQPWISPLTQLVWYLDAGAVARSKLFFEAARGSETVAEVADAIEAVRRERGVREYEGIPI